eukprot:jgi/Ulvmu1/2989/UM015_0029.1
MKAHPTHLKHRDRTISVAMTGSGCDLPGRLTIAPLRTTPADSPLDKLELYFPPVTDTSAIHFPSQFATSDPYLRALPSALQHLYANAAHQPPHPRTYHPLALRVPKLSPTRPSERLLSPCQPPQPGAVPFCSETCDFVGGAAALQGVTAAPRRAAIRADGCKQFSAMQLLQPPLSPETYITSFRSRHSDLVGEVTAVGDRPCSSTPLIHTTDTKECSKCRQIKAFPQEYHRSGTAKNSNEITYRPDCIDCHRALDRDAKRKKRAIKRVQEDSDSETPRKRATRKAISFTYWTSSV